MHYMYVFILKTNEFMGKTFLGDLKIRSGTYFRSIEVTKQICRYTCMYMCSCLQFTDVYFYYNEHNRDSFVLYGEVMCSKWYQGTSIEHGLAFYSTYFDY